MRAPVLIVPRWTVDVDWLGRRSGGGLCWGATRQGIAGRKLTVMRPAPTGIVRRRRCSWPRLGIGHHRRFPHPLKTHRAERPGDAITPLGTPTPGSAR
jgi:hypothetical protein